MKGRAAMAVSALLFVGALVGAAFGAKSTAKQAPMHTQYPRGGKVMNIDDHTDVVTWVDGSGLAWSFSGVEDWMVGDFVATIMDDNGTPNDITDDVIVDVRYAG